MKDVFISVIIPIYNGKKYIESCLDSILLSLENVKSTCEINIIDDGSNDNPKEIIDKYSNIHNKLINYYEKEHSGLADTKNYGIEQSNGRYLSFVDIDDTIDKSFFKTAINIIEETNADMVIYDWETIDIANKTKYRVPGKNPNISDTMWGCIDVSIMPSSCNKIVKKTLFNNLKFPIGLLYEDLGTTLVTFFKANHIEYIPQMYYKYNLTPNSIMRTKFDERKFQMFEIFQILFDRVNNLEFVSDLDKQRALFMVYTRRLYEDILEPITNEKFKERYKLCKKMCKKIGDIDEQMLKNTYFFKEVFETNNSLKNICNRILHFLLNKKLPFILSIFLHKRLYYRLFSIIYGRTTIDIK